MITENIHDLEHQAQKVFKELNYSEHILRKIRIVARKLISIHDEQGEKQLNNEIINTHLKHRKTDYESGKITSKTFSHYKKAVDYLIQIYTTGTIITKRNKIHPPLPEPFEQLQTDISSVQRLSPRSKEALCEHLRSFFRWLISFGHNDLSRVDEEVIREYLMFCAGTLASNTLYGRRRAIKTLMLFISENYTLSESMSRLFIFRIPKQKRIRSLIPQDEIAAVLNVINRSTVQGKRDYAIILLAAVTGLRGIDIVELTLDSLIWQDGEIRMVQEKTGKALALPLTSDVGIAIREYILNARPPSESRKVFLSTLAPFGSMSRVTLYSGFNRYCVKAGITTQRGFHMIRRSVATNMIISGTSVITVSQALGHSTINPTKQYISLASRQLKECALDFNGIQTGGAL